MNRLSVWITKQGGTYFCLLGALVFFLPYERFLQIELNYFSIDYTLRISHVVAVGLLGVFAYRKLNKQQKIQFTTVDISLAVFIFIYLLTSLLANDLARSLSVWVFTTFVVVLAIVISKIVKRDMLPRLEPYLAITSWIVIIFGFYQYIGDTIGLPNSLTNLRSIYAHAILGFPRVQAFSLEPLYYANFLLIPLFIYSSLFIFDLKNRPWLLGAIMIQLYLTVSRGALLSAVIGYFALFIYLRIRRKGIKLQKILSLLTILFITILTTYLLVLLAGKMTEWQSHFNEDNRLSSEQRFKATFRQATNPELQVDRIKNRTLAVQAFKSNPLIGIGPGNFSNYAKENVMEYKNIKNKIVVNNEPLELLAETGIVGGISILIVLGVIIFRIIVLLNASMLTDELSVIILALSTYFIALMAQYQTFSTLYIIHIWVALGFLLGIVEIARSKQLKS